MVKIIVMSASFFGNTRQKGEANWYQLGPIKNNAGSTKQSQFVKSGKLIEAPLLPNLGVKHRRSAR